MESKEQYRAGCKQFCCEKCGNVLGEIYTDPQHVKRLRIVLGQKMIILTWGDVWCDVCGESRTWLPSRRAIKVYIHGYRELATLLTN